jgi:hypothetical protein
MLCPSHVDDLPAVLQDEETGQYRQRMAALNTYCTANNLSAVSVVCICS